MEVSVAIFLHCA